MATVTLKMKALREEVVDKIYDLMRGGKTMQFEMKFDRQDGMSYKAILDTNPAKFVSGKFFFDEKGNVIEGSLYNVTAEVEGEYPHRLYDIYDSVELEVGNEEPEFIGDGFQDHIGTGEPILMGDLTAEELAQMPDFDSADDALET